MKGYIESILDKICVTCQSTEGAGMNYYYAIFRVLVGFMFMLHGIQKLFGGMGGIDGQGGTVALFTLFGLAGLIEFLGGLAVALGFLTRLFGLIASLEMLVAYFMVHYPQGINPILNQGELALMYFVAFLLVAKIGAGKWSLERLMLKREVF